MSTFKRIKRLGCAFNKQFSQICIRPRPDKPITIHAHDGNYFIYKWLTSLLVICAGGQVL